MSERKKKFFQKENIIYVDGTYLLSPTLVGNCKLRLEIGQIVRKALSAGYSQLDKDFARKHSKEIVDVLRKIWHSTNYASDGAGPNEKFSLLYNRGLNDKEIVPFIGELLEKDGFNPKCEFCLEPNLHFILFNYPRISLDPIVLARLNVAEKNNDVLEQVFALVILNKNARNSKYLSKLKKIANNKEISLNEKRTLMIIIRKFELEKKLDFEDLDNFTFSYIDAQPTAEEN